MTGCLLSYNSGYYFPSTAPGPSQRVSVATFVPVTVTVLPLTAAVKSRPINVFESVSAGTVLPLLTE